MDVIHEEIPVFPEEGIGTIWKITAIMFPEGITEEYPEGYEFHAVIVVPIEDFNYKVEVGWEWAYEAVDSSGQQALDLVEDGYLVSGLQFEGFVELDDEGRTELMGHWADGTLMYAGVVDEDNPLEDDEE